ncbi:putative transporter [Lachnellula willkommii]|uniref:Putative transporter n=1 Tax=Lachnellula willkommii TaxID=215461 RepID=A0A559ME38_9HELO|nr:putative transporter [Lachnellula willkommii]
MNDKNEIKHAEDTPHPDVVSLSEAHKQYLLEKHHTLELDPLPDLNDADPYNWPFRKKLVNLLLVAFHAMMATFTAAAIQSAFVDIALDLNVSIQRASYLTSLVIAILGGAPLIWRPLADRYGRRPIFLISLVGSLVCNIGCARSPTYNIMGLCRGLTAFFISPAAALGSATVTETFFKHERARYIGIWTVMVTLGVPVAPVIFGFVAYRVGYRWIYWILAITNGIQFILYLFFGLESRYIRGQEQGPISSFKQQYFNFHRIDPTQLTFWSFTSPLKFVTRLCVFIPAVAYSMVFLLASVMITIEIPQLFVEKFNLNTEQVGLQNIGIIIGTLTGEQVGGIMSDRWMSRRQRKLPETTSVQPEFRLWLSYSGCLLAICGVIVFLVQIDRASDSWNITPIIGAGIAAAGNQIVTTVLITYAIDCYRHEAASVGVFITFVRQTWGFIGPFWFNIMIANVGLVGSAGITTALMVGGSIIPIIFLQWRGGIMR